MVKYFLVSLVICQVASQEINNGTVQPQPPVDPTRCATGTSPWPDTMNCFQCVIDGCISLCKTANRLPAWFEGCYHKDTWSSMTTLLGKCLAETSPICVRFPLGSALTALTGSRKKREAASSTDFLCLGTCMFREANGCMQNCTEAPSNNIEDHPITQCFIKNQQAIENLTDPFINCAVKATSA